MVKTQQKHKEKTLGNSTKNRTAWLPENYKEPPSSKFLGYCPKCNLMINKSDLQTSSNYKCSSCDKNGKIIDLIKDKPKHKKIRSDYGDIESVKHVQVPLETTIDPKDIRVIE